MRDKRSNAALCVPTNLSRSFLGKRAMTPGEMCAQLTEVLRLAEEVLSAEDERWAWCGFSQSVSASIVKMGVL
jgi:hypothetical protein